MTELKTFSELARMIEQEQRAEAARIKQEKTERRRAHDDNTVVGGVYWRDPVDKAAAMMLAQAPWWAMPPIEKQEQKEESKVMPMREERRIDSGGCLRFGKEIVMEGGDGRYDTTELAAAIVRHFESTTPKELSNVARSVLDARGAIADGIKNVGNAIEEFESVTTAAVRTARSRRMTTVTECASMVNALKDVRQFFLGPDYDREQARLREFVELCERLESLKASGFLDTVADTMIRLASYEKLT